MECNVKGVTVHYEEAGSGRPLLLLHGWACDHRSMSYAFEPLFTARAGWRRLYPDLPGMGLTRGYEWITAHDDMLNVVCAFMDAVAPGERVTIAGASYGGYLARGLVYRRAARLLGVMMLVPLVETDAAKKDLPPHRVLHEDPAFLAALRPDEEYLRGSVVMQSMELLRTFREVVKPPGAVADPAFLNRLERHMAFSFDVDTLAEPFPAPTLILCGRQDNWCSYREAYRLLDRYPRATYAALDCAGHFLPVEREALFRSLASEWLDRVEAYAP